MKATRFHQWLIIVALMGGMGVGVTSCKDSDKDDSTNNDAKSEMTEEELAHRRGRRPKSGVVMVKEKRSGKHKCRRITKWKDNKEE